ncbi:hypothetical protein FQZ97_639700 [compost metagenome]
MDVEVAMDQDRAPCITRDVAAQPVQQPTHVRRGQVIFTCHIAIPTFKVVAVALFHVGGEDAGVLVTLDVIGEHVQRQGMQLAEAFSQLHEQAFIDLAV